MPAAPPSTLFLLISDMMKNYKFTYTSIMKPTYTRLISSPFSTGNNVKTLVHTQEHTQAIKSPKCSLRIRFEETIGQIAKSIKQAESASRLKKL